MSRRKISKAGTVERAAARHKEDNQSRPSVDQVRTPRSGQLLTAALFKQANGSSLAFFRIAVGIVMALEAWTLLQPSESSSGKVLLDTYYTNPDITFNFPYEWFFWLPLFSPPIIYGIVAALGIAAVFMALGLFYRVAALLVFLCWGYLYAVESTRTYWMSYYYLELLLTFLLIWMPAHRRFSLDALLARSRGKPFQTLVPFWSIALLRAQLVVTYFYAGVAKVNADWLLDAVPVRDFLAHPSVIKRFEPFVGDASLQGIQAFLQNPTLAYALSWIGALFDLSIGFLLLGKRTRPAGMVLLVIFHSTNNFILFNDIIWFPLIGILTATIFLEPDWAERFVNRWRTTKKPVVDLGTTNISQLQTAWLLRLFLGWIICQGVIPLRHYFIPGDGRFTWEGIPFSWRLKAEIYRSAPCEITVSDSFILSRDPSGLKIDLSKWNEPKVLYRWANPSSIPWEKLPELLVLFEKELGERVVYNPYSGSNGPRTDSECRSKITNLWMQAYGRTPREVRPTIKLEDIIDGYARALVARGAEAPKGKTETLALLLQANGVKGNGQMVPFLRRAHPFSMNGAPPPATPFYLIEDPLLFTNSPGKHLVLDQSLWKSSAEHLGSSTNLFVNHAPLIITTAEDRFDSRMLFPQTYLFESLDAQDQGPLFYWDYLRDIPPSKGMHISSQPFLLRRYARRVADLWKENYGNYPSVYADTSMSLNRRPYQRIVDPKADLAAVPVTHFWHNPWIKDLETKRIPVESLKKD